MPLNSYLKLSGAKQGEIKGSVTEKGRQGKIMVIAFNHEVQFPLDLATGQATGKRIHRPFIITKEIDRSSPLLYSALVNNENIVDWELLCFANSIKGTEINNYTVVLKNARIVDIRSIMLNNKITENIKMPLMEDVSFVYEKIEWTWVKDGLITEDEWTSSNV